MEYHFAFEHLCNIKEEILCDDSNYRECVFIKQESPSATNIGVEETREETNVYKETHGDTDTIIIKQETDCDRPKPNRRCDICAKESASGKKLIAHRYTHTSDNRYTCCICYSTYICKKKPTRAHVYYTLRLDSPRHQSNS